MTRDLTVGVVGLGFGANHARVLSEMPGVRLAAVADGDPERLAAFDASGLHRYPDHASMLAAERLDAVVVAVPARQHVDVALAAIDVGCAVLVEKPLAPSHDEGARLVSAARLADVPLMAGHVERFNPAVQEMAQRLRRGELGRVLHVAARRLAYFPERQRNIDLGVVHDLAYHDIDVMRFLLAEEVARVSAETYSNVQTPYEDALTALLRFGSGVDPRGPIGTLEVNRLSPRMVRELTVLGERGAFIASYADFRSATLDFLPAQSLEGSRASESTLSLRGREPGPAQRIPIEPREPLRQEHSAFIQALRDGAPMPVSGEDALAALAVADALVRSARTGATVALERLQ